MFCSNCGKELVEGAKFCSECGAPVGAIVANERKPDSATDDPTQHKIITYPSGKKIKAKHHPSTPQNAHYRSVERDYNEYKKVIIKQEQRKNHLLFLISILPIAAIAFHIGFEFGLEAGVITFFVGLLLAPLINFLFFFL